MKYQTNHWGTNKNIAKLLNQFKVDNSSKNCLKIQQMLNISRGAARRFPPLWSLPADHQAKSAIGLIVSHCSSVIGWIVSHCSSVIGWIVSHCSSVIGWIMSHCSSVIGWIVSHCSSVIGWIVSHCSSVIGWIVSHCHPSEGCREAAFIPCTPAINSQFKWPLLWGGRGSRSLMPRCPAGRHVSWISAFGNHIKLSLSEICWGSCCRCFLWLVSKLGLDWRRLKVHQIQIQVLDN